jgi:hypothetical protein
MTKAGDTIPNTEAPSDSEPDTTPATPDALGDQMRGAMAAIDDPSYLKAANDYANVMLAIEANGVV